MSTKKKSDKSLTKEERAKIVAAIQATAKQIDTIQQDVKEHPAKYGNPPNLDDVINKVAKAAANAEHKPVAYPPPNKPSEPEVRTTRDTFGLVWTFLLIAGLLGAGAYIFITYF